MVAEGLWGRLLRCGTGRQGHENATALLVLQPAAVWSKSRGAAAGPPGTGGGGWAVRPPRLPPSTPSCAPLSSHTSVTCAHPHMPARPSGSTHAPPPPPPPQRRRLGPAAPRAGAAPGHARPPRPAAHHARGAGDAGAHALRRPLPPAALRGVVCVEPGRVCVRGWGGGWGWGVCISCLELWIGRSRRAPCCSACTFLQPVPAPDTRALLRAALQAALLARGRTVRQAKLFFYAKMAEKGLATYERDGWGEFPTQVGGRGMLAAAAAALTSRRVLSQ